jgi:T5SS/PEP-CTERM-associated repeat protein
MKMKSKEMTTLHLRKSIGFLIPLAFVCLALSASPDSRAAADCLCATSWTGAIDNNWFNSGNWSEGVPDCFNAQICSGHPVGPQINRGSPQISTQAQTAKACEMFIGYASGDSGSLSVNHGTLSQCGDIFVGWQGTGKLSIYNGGIVSTDFNPSIASETGSNGSVTVDGQYQDGTKSQWTVLGELEVGGTINGGAGGTALLSVTNSGKVTAATIHVWKSGTLTGNNTVGTTSGMTVDGTLSPSGQLTIGGAGGLQLNNGGATTQCKVTPQDPSTTPQVSVSAQVSLGGRLSVTMTGDFSSAPTRFTLLYADSVNSLHRQFDSQSITYPTGQGCWVPQITYDYSGGHVHVYLDRVYNCN